MRQTTLPEQTAKLIELGFEKPKGWCVKGISSRLQMYKHKEDDEEFNYSIVELSVPAYDEWNLWAARTKDGGWFTFDIQSTWQGGELDIDGTLYQSLKANIEWLKKEYGGEYPINDDNVE